MIPYILLATAFSLTILTATVRTAWAPFIVALSLIANIGAVESAKGWPTDWVQVPEKGIMWAAFGNHFVVVSALDKGAWPRLYRFDYPQGLEKILNEEGIGIYDRHPGEGHDLGDESGLGEFQFTPLKKWNDGKQTTQ